MLASSPDAPSSSKNACDHIREVLAHLQAADEGVEPQSEGCRECLESGDPWVQLRLCLSCGHVGCCDSSINRHATKHFHHTRHPVIQSFQPNEEWGWCYVDSVMLELPKKLAKAPKSRKSA
jgi:uncharacterized UBP type Zn finger protein